MNSITELDTLTLHKAIGSLRRALVQLDKTPEDEFVRDACVQRFEFTYELCSKFLRRYLVLTETSADDVQAMSFPTLIRTASERGLLLNEWSVWILYREKRNITSHTYDEDKVDNILGILPLFLIEAEYVLKQIDERKAP
jgi:nucleotidyltransferase substrate binding protein (TIGR01987 family)